MNKRHNGQIMRPGAIEMGLNFVPGPNATAVANTLGQHGSVQMNVVGGFSKPEAAALHFMAGLAIEVEKLPADERAAYVQSVFNVAVQCANAFIDTMNTQMHEVESIPPSA